ncbi:MAG: VWA domain-containing protein [Vicinamibacterales bacterium]
MDNLRQRRSGQPDARGSRQALRGASQPHHPAVARQVSAITSAPARAGLTLVLCAITLSVAVAQQALVGRVLLATVTNSSDQPLIDLEADDFIVREDGQEREILSARIADYPLVLLIDNSAHAANDLEAIRSAAGRFVERVGDRAVAVVTLADPPAILAGLGDDRTAVRSAIENVQLATEARRPLEAVSQATRLIEDARSGFAAIVVISVTPAGAPDPEPRGLVSAFVQSGDILHLVTRTQPVVPGAAAALTPEDLLRDIATRSGGRVSTIYSPVSFQVALDQIADRMATEMLVEYLAPQGAPVPADVRVGVAIPGTRVRGLGVLR